MAKGDRARAVLAAALADALTAKTTAPPRWRAWLPTALDDAEADAVFAALRVHALFGAWEACAVPASFDMATALRVWGDSAGALLEASEANLALAHTLAATDREAVRAAFDADGGGPHDRMARMFEHVLSARDAGHRLRRGVFFTPQPVVDYVLASVAALWGPEPVTVWDPAAGTGAFVRAAAARFPHAHVVASELDPAAMAVAHLQRTLSGESRPITWHLGDALEALPEKPSGSLVVVGNPPFAGHSKHRGGAIADLLRGRDPETGDRCASYFDIDGASLGERNPKWVQDDYVKFVRLAHAAVVRAGSGMVAFVTGHGFFAQPTFRAMRHALLRDFDELWLLDLHGNAKKFETTDGDQNVFRIGTGVGVVLLVRRTGRGTDGVHFAERWGPRADKLAWLGAHDVSTTAWVDVAARAPAFCFVPRDERLREEYDRGLPLPEIFPVNTVGVVTGDDARHVSRDRTALANPVPCLYRPFDRRWLAYDHDVLERSRRAVMPTMALPGALALIARRQSPAARPWTYVFAAREIVVDGAIRSDNHGSETVFPVWLAGDRPNVSASAIEHIARAWERTWSPGRGPGTGETFTAEDVAAYAYAMLHAPSFRRRYASLLRTAFPRVPFARGHLDALLAHGRVLLGVHTGDGCLAKRGQPPAAGPGASRQVTLHFKGRGRHVDASDGQVLTSVRWQDDTVWINGAPRFTPVEESLWTFAIGGYEPARKWLLDRRGTALPDADCAAYESLLQALRETARVMTAIDACLSWE